MLYLHHIAWHDATLDQYQPAYVLYSPYCTGKRANDRPTSVPTALLAVHWPDLLLPGPQVHVWKTPNYVNSSRVHVTYAHKTAKSITIPLECLIALCCKRCNAPKPACRNTEVNTYMTVHSELVVL